MFAINLQSSCMIAHLRGRLISKHPNQAIVETAGVGYDVTITVPTFSEPARAGSLSRAAHSHSRARRLPGPLRLVRRGRETVVREAHTVSGIEPKLAITVLSGMPAADMVGAIRGDDFARLTRFRESARRLPRRMCVELRTGWKDSAKHDPQCPFCRGRRRDRHCRILATSVLLQRKQSSVLCSPLAKRISMRCSARRWRHCFADKRKREGLESRKANV